VPFVVGESIGPYRITKQLGVGGMATVWKAYHPALDRYVAIKVLHPSFKEDPQFTTRFQREARIVAKLIHPHIVPIYDFSQHEGMSYLVMRYIDGRTLKALLKEGSLPLDRMMEIVEPAGQALAYAHDQGVLHRDIKPSNFIISSEGEIFLTDFGLARMAESTDITLSRDMLVGTPQYISPEQARGERLDARTDVYSLGVVLFEMLTGKVPYDADTPYAVIHDHIFSPLPLPTEFNPALPETVERVVLKALAKDRNDRFTGVREMVSALEEALRGARVAVDRPRVLPEETPHAVTVAPPGADPPPEPLGEPSPEEEPVEPKPPQKSPAGSRRPRRLVVLAGAVGALLTLCVCAFLFVVMVGRPDADDSGGVVQATATPMREDPAAHVQLARRYLQQGNVGEAIAEYEVAIEPDPGFAEAYAGLGNVYAREKDLERALEFYERALEADPDHVKAHLGMGDVYVVWGEYDAAAYHYEIVVGLDPEVPGPHAKLGMCHVLVGELELGREECERALRMDPQVPEGHFCMGLFFVRQGDTESARREFEIVVDTAPGFLEEQARRQLDRLE
jgi:serine/threonine protein kinase/Tfp pilus assembly protein PilF